MSDQLTRGRGRQRLVEEISRLRGQLRSCRSGSSSSTSLAHQDSLIDLPNRRGFLRELETADCAREPLRRGWSHAVRRRRRAEDASTTLSAIAAATRR